jgi:EAL domain-containing protein (putative c-di-GMP-specific phosphodiesterase class I)
LAEETGLINPIGRWVLTHACRQARAWDAEGHRPITMSVNVSGRQIAMGPVLVDEVAAVIAETGLEPARLSIEVTESLLMADVEGAAITIAALKDLGVHLSLDDFGTGYSSLSYLRRFPFDVLKIDRSFVMAMGDGPDQMTLARSILALASELRLKTVAEGIEEAEQLDALLSMGADFGQGYLFAKPMPASLVSALLAAESAPVVETTARLGALALRP